MTILRNKDKHWVTFSFFASSLLTLYCIMTGQWWWTIIFSLFMLGQYKVFSKWFNVYKDETKH